MLKSSLCDYADACILVNGTITVTGVGDDAAARQADERNKGVIFKNCAPFTKCISKINDAEIDNAQDIDIVMPMYNLIEYSNNYSKTSSSLWQYYIYEPNDNLADSESFKSKVKITGSTPADGNTKGVKIVVPLKYLSNFWRTLEMPLINGEVSPFLTWSSTFVIINSTGNGDFESEDAKLYVPVVTLSIQDNSKLLQQLKSGLRRTINWKKHQSNPKTYERKRYLNYSVDSSFQGVNRPFVLSFENEADRTSYSTYYLPKIEIKDYNIMIDGKNFFDQPTNSDLKTYENILKIATGRGDDYTTGCLLVILTLKIITK